MRPLKKGDLLEKDISLEFHHEGVPFLVSSLVLRENGCGQVDLCRVIKRKGGEKVIEVLEVKSSRGPSGYQYRRLRQSAEFLSLILGYPALVKEYVRERIDEEDGLEYF